MMRNIMIVDDNEGDREMLKKRIGELLEEVNYIEVSTREDFYRQVERGDLDMVVSDFNVHLLDGLEVLSEVRKRHSELPLIVYTGTGSEEIAVKAMKMGATDYLIKDNAHSESLGAKMIETFENSPRDEVYSDKDEALDGKVRARPSERDAMEHELADSYRGILESLRLLYDHPDTTEGQRRYLDEAVRRVRTSGELMRKFRGVGP